jgi:hypothetical protein
MAKRRKNPKGPPYWIGVVVGLGLVVFPDPLTTATGLAILAGTFALGASDDRKQISDRGGR